MPFEKYVEFTRRLSPTVMLGFWGERINGVITGLLWDWITQGMSEAVLAPFLTRAEQPPDALPVIGNERRLAKYIIEDDLQWQQRLLGAWEIWEKGGSGTLILEQLTAAGYVGAEIHSPLDWNRPPADWPSQFWILLPTGAHNGMFSAAPVIPAVEGQHLCGITGPTENVAELRYIAQNFRPADEVCRLIIVVISGDICGEVTCPHMCGGAVGLIGTGIPEE